MIFHLCFHHLQSARAHNSTVQYSHADHMQFLELLIDLDVAPESDLWASFHKDEADIVRETLRVVFVLWAHGVQYTW